MKIYIKSSGYYQKQEYVWREEEPSILRKQGIITLVDNDYFSVVIGRYDSKLLLYVTGLESKREDYRTRQIRNSVVWESDDDKDEEDLRKVAALALQGKLKDKIEAAIKEEKNTPYGFTIQFDKVTPKALLRDECEDTKANKEIIGSELDESKNYIAHDNETRRLQLANELRQRSLPSRRQGTLVVVTTSTTEEQLRKQEVWRGLSSLVKEEDDWQLIPERVNLMLLGQPINLRNILPKLLMTNGVIALIIIPYLSYRLISLTSCPSPPPCPAIVPGPINVYSLSIGVNDQISLKGDYNPQQLKTVSLLADDKETPLATEDNIKFDAENRQWKFVDSQGFKEPGTHRIRIKGTDIKNELILDQIIYINVYPDRKNQAQP